MVILVYSKVKTECLSLIQYHQDEAMKIYSQLF